MHIRFSTIVQLFQYNRPLYVGYRILKTEPLQLEFKVSLETWQSNLHMLTVLVVRMMMRGQEACRHRVARRKRHLGVRIIKRRLSGAQGKTED